MWKISRESQQEVDKKKWGNEEMEKNIVFVIFAKLSVEQNGKHSAE